MRQETTLIAGVICHVAMASATCPAEAANGARRATEKKTLIRVTNYENGTTSRYPVPLVHGTLADSTLTSVEVINRSSSRDTRVMRGLAHKGRFKVLTELVPGENKLTLRAGRHEVPLTLLYKPQTNPYVVRVIYFTDKTGNTEYQTPIENDPQDYRGKLDTAMKLLQTFTAERLHDLGLGRVTFNLELDGRGKVRVHTLKGNRTAAQYHKLNGHQLYSHIAGMIARKLPHRKSRDLAIPAFTRFDPKTRKVYAHTALGGGNLALFGGGNLFAWPSSLADAQKVFMDATRVDTRRFFSDSVGRHTFWAVASTTMGAALHELGHTFGLPHSRDPHDIMTRGIDRLNRVFTFVDPPHARRKEAYEFKDDEVAYWAPVSAAALVPNRFFAMHARPYTDENKTSVRLDTESRKVVIESENGIRFVGVNLYGPKIGVVAVCHIPLDQHTAPPKQVSIPVVELGNRVGTPKIALKIIDDQGLSTGVRIRELLAGPFVQAWRFSPITLPWKNTKSFVEVDAKKLKAIEASAASAKLARSGTRFVDFLPHFPKDKRAYVAGYAVRTIRSEQPRKVKIHTGSDDALRMWLNGKLITQVLKLRPPAPDAETNVAELRAGENRLLIEVSQAGGGWGLFLRLEDASGTKLELKDNGDLVPVDDRAARRILALLRGSYVRNWRFASVTCPWKDKSSFVQLDPKKLMAIEASAASAKLVEGDLNSPIVDFRAHFPRGKQTNVAGYVFRTIGSDRPRKVKIYTGSDDALRIWLNGKLIAQVLKLRGAAPDAESNEATLEKGENRLLVEVANGVGGWGLVLRIEDADGASLMLADDGRLVRTR